MTRTYTNPGPISFSAIIQQSDAADITSAWIDFPYDLKSTYGVGNLVPCVATFDGRVEYRGSLVKMGGEHAMILLRKDVRTSLGKEPGDTVQVVVELDEALREVAIPRDLEEALCKAGILETFTRLAYSHRREYVVWIEEAKRPETRSRRVAQTVERLSSQN